MDTTTVKYVLNSRHSTRNIVRLTLKRRINRKYGMWWDIINTSLVVFLLFVAFGGISLLMITDRLDIAPFYSSIWNPFETAIDIGRRAELGLGILSVAVSGASAAALYLIGQGTRRWAMNRRIGLFHLFAAEDNISRLGSNSFEEEAVKNSMTAFLDGTQNLYEDINVLHQEAQVAFETLRLRILAARNSSLDHNDLEDLAVDQLFIALLCLERIEPVCQKEFLVKWFGDQASITDGIKLRDTHRSLAVKMRLPSDRTDKSTIEVEE
jgi:hypothetical protein